MTAAVYSAVFIATVMVMVTTGVLSHDPQPPMLSQSPLKLTVTPAHISEKTTGHVTLHCEIDIRYEFNIKVLYWMRVLKKIPNGWSLVAQIKDSTGVESKSEHVSAVGHMGNSPEDAYLMVRWVAQNEHVFGEYVCDALGIDEHMQFVVHNSSKLSVKEQNITTQELLDFLTNAHSEIRKETGELADDVKENTSLMSDLFSRVEELERQMEEHSHDESGGEDDVSNQNDTSKWPRGNVGLLMPESGCPVDPAFDHSKTSFVKFHVESLPNGTCATHQPDFHLSEPYATENNSECYINLRFCEASNLSSTTPWPEGSYCLNWDSHHLCPSSFKPGRVVLDQVDGTRSHVANSSVVELSGTYTYLHFCCKETRTYDIPMVLPTDSPFYLYRFGGACQTVEGMNVSREYIDIDTEDRQNGDSGHGVHPDIAIQPGQPTRIELCYYTIGS